MFPRYGGRTAMAILEPYGFEETHSDDWVSLTSLHVPVSAVQWPHIGMTRSL